VRAATLARVSVALLAVATFLAIFYAQELKRRDPLLMMPTGHWVQRFQPAGPLRDPHRYAHFDVKATVDDTLVVSIASARTGATVDTVTLTVSKYRRAPISWNGRLRSGALAPPGRYRIRVHFEHGGQTIAPAAQLQLDGPHR